MRSKVHHFPWSIRKYLSYNLYILVLAYSCKTHKLTEATQIVFPFKVQQVCDSFLKCYQHVVGRYFVTYFQKHRFFILTLILRFHGNFHGKETYIFFKHCTFFCVF